MVTQLVWFCPVEIKSWLDAGIFFSAVVAMRLHPSEKKDSVKGDVALHVTHCKIKKIVSFDFVFGGIKKTRCWYIELYRWWVVWWFILVPSDIIYLLTLLYCCHSFSSAFQLFLQKHLPSYGISICLCCIQLTSLMLVLIIPKLQLHPLWICEDMLPIKFNKVPGTINTVGMKLH